MTDPQTPARTDPAGDEASPTWAPWWIYMIVLLGANYLRNDLLPGDALPVPLIVAIAVGQAGLLFGVITVVWRATRRGDRSS